MVYYAHIWVILLEISELLFKVMDSSIKLKSLFNNAFILTKKNKN